MKYRSGGAFRRALEDRLRNQALSLGLPLVRLRKMVAFERLLARLVADQPGRWLLKGGLALQWRLGNVARATRDLDMALTAPVDDVHQALVRAALVDLDDWFRFLVEEPAGAAGQAVGGLRFHTRALLDGRLFEAFHIDTAWGDPLVEAPERVTAPPLLSFAGIRPTTILCYPMTQHVAEKVHAYTRPHASGESSRVKDLVDIVLIGQTSRMGSAALGEALRATFESRGTHPLPPSLPEAPAAWAGPFRHLAGNLRLGVHTVATAGKMARSFLDPVLRGEAAATWNPEAWKWQP